MQVQLNHYGPSSLSENNISEQNIHSNSASLSGNYGNNLTRQLKLSIEFQMT